MNHRTGDTHLTVKHHRTSQQRELYLFNA